jgi:(2Fe-2S) ferredoxin
MSFYSKHVFICTNQREDGRPCCQDYDTRALFKQMKEKAREEGLLDPEGIRINKSGCLGRCGEGPVLVVYPDNVWYTFQNSADLDEILEKQVKQGEIVERLVI